jgi:pSer/pThr/pTyr-binding forkhead associated (FHA) protein
VDADNPKTEKPSFKPLALRSVSSDEIFQLTSETLVGREVECTISLDSPHVSRYHAKLVVTDNGVVLEDLRSSNGTFVNGKRINNKTRVSVGDEIRFDELAFRLTTAANTEGTADATVMVSRERLNEKIQSAPQEPALAGTQHKSPEKPKPQIAAVSPAPAPAEPAQAAVAAPADQDDENTRLLSSEQINQYASINKHFQKMVDTGSGPRLIAMTAPVRGKVFRLNPIDGVYKWTVGRSKETDVCLPDKSVSRQHAWVEKIDGKFEIHTMEGSSPVLINGEEMGNAILKHNDHVQIAHAEFVFRLDEQKNKPSSRPLPEQETSNNTPWIIGVGVVGTLLLLGVAITMMMRG